MSPEENTRFEAILAALELENTAAPAADPRFSGDWDLLWTCAIILWQSHSLFRTESELLFAIEKGLFGNECTGVFQTIDLDAGRLESSTASRRCLI
jgi:hypothetical protein